MLPMTHVSREQVHQLVQVQQQISREVAVLPPVASQLLEGVLVLVQQQEGSTPKLRRVVSAQFRNGQVTN